VTAASAELAARALAVRVALTETASVAAALQLLDDLAAGQ
jgi:hypothetical protein